MERPIVVIISDEPEFSTATTRRWMAERDVPSFMLIDSSSCNRLENTDFDLAIIGGVAAQSITAVFAAVQSSGKTGIYVSHMNAHASHAPNVISLPDIPGWSDVLVTVGTQVLERERAVKEVSALLESSVQLEQLAALGRYMLEVRHNLNNALTSVLGNADLILLDDGQLPAATRSQVETIRNMGMRMNEILHRFSSLQKEMQLVEQQTLKSPAISKSARAGA